MADPLDHLYENLLRAGIALRSARRYCAELADHREDIAADLIANGMDRDTALREAQRRLGDADQLALPMLVNPRFRGVAGRLPALVFLAIPVLCQLAASALLVIALVLFARLDRSIALLTDIASVISLLWLALPVVIAWLVFAAAWRRRANRLWPAIMASTGALLAAAFNLDILPPAENLPGAVSVALATPSLLPALVLLALCLAPLSLQPRPE